MSVRKRFELTGRNYVVTGAAMGIGYAIAHDICEMGGNVAVLDMRPTPLEPLYDLPGKFNVKAEYFQADVSDEASLQAGFDKAVSALGSIDGIVTAAGIAIDKAFPDQGWEEVNKVLQVNSMGTFFAAQMAVRQMKKQGTPGSVVLIASITSHVNLPGYRMAGYNMSKGVLVEPVGCSNHVGNPALQTIRPENSLFSHTNPRGSPTPAR